MLNIEPIEHRVMSMLLAGSHPALQTLRKQFERSHVSSREFTGIGFFTSFEIPDNHPRIESLDNFLIDDVCSDRAIVKSGVQALNQAAT